MSMRNCCLQGILTFAALLCGASLALADSTGPKLKYRSSGPVCSCESGTGEAEIRAAMARLGIQDDAARTSASSRSEVGYEEHSKESLQQRRETDEERR
jgi:hypothetical protein